MKCLVTHVKCLLEAVQHQRGRPTAKCCNAVNSIYAKIGQLDLDIVIEKLITVTTAHHRPTLQWYETIVHSTLCSFKVNFNIILLSMPMEPPPHTHTHTITYTFSFPATILWAFFISPIPWHTSHPFCSCSHLCTQWNVQIMNTVNEHLLLVNCYFLFFGPDGSCSYILSVYK